MSLTDVYFLSIPVLVTRVLDLETRVTLTHSCKRAKLLLYMELAQMQGSGTQIILSIDGDLELC